MDLECQISQDPNCKQWHEINKNADWIKIQGAVTKLFQMRRLPELATELPVLNEKLTKLSQSEIGQFIGEFYQEHILKKCMIILRQEVVEEKGSELLQKLAEIWTQFYTSILPTLQAIFIPVQLKFLSVRALTLISFRDVVLLKTDITNALQTDVPPPPQIKQMLLVLQSVRRSPPADQFFQLQSLVGKVVKPYMYMVKHSRVGGRPPSEPPQEELSKRANRAETVIESPPSQRRSSTVKRRHSLSIIQDATEAT